jgi:hypothetical protein
MGSPRTDAPKSTPGHGGARANSGRKSATSTQGDAYTLLAKAKAKRETYLAQMAELDYRQRSGELLKADEVAETWLEQVAIAKGRLLALPSRVAPALVGMSDLRAIEVLLRDALTQIMEELAGD